MVENIKNKFVSTIRHCHVIWINKIKDYFIAEICKTMNV